MSHGKETFLKDEKQSKGFFNCGCGTGGCSNYSIAELLNFCHWHAIKINLIISVRRNFLKCRKLQLLRLPDSGD
jgi:hypothetical protein